MTTCDVCDEDNAVVRCDECDMNLCKEDNVEVHKPAKKAAHARRPLTAQAVICELCDAENARLSCEQCEQSFCAPCSQGLHKPARMAGHTLTPIPGVSQTVPKKDPEVAAAEAQAEAEVAKEEEEEAAAAAAAAEQTSSTRVAEAPAEAEEVEEEEEEESSATAAASSSFSTPQRAKPARAMSASASASSLRSTQQASAGRPRSAMPARTPGVGSGDGTGTAQAGLPKKLVRALSPQRSVLSMSEGTRWEEPDLRPFRGPPGTFGTTLRDSSPSRKKNLLYSKSAGDLLQGHEDGSSPWQRLSKPKVFVSSVISPLFDDIRHCRFTPQINPLSQELASGDFRERLSASVDSYVTRRLRAESEAYLSKDATFQPKLNASRPGSAVASGREAFVARMQEDTRKRTEHAEQMARSLKFPFAPSISASSKKRAARITTPFLDRLAEDLNVREDQAATRRAEANRLPDGAFHPNPARLSTTKYSWNAFLGRMNNDWEERKTKYEERCKMFGLPTPEEVAASVRGGGRK